MRCSSLVFLTVLALVVLSDDAAAPPPPSDVIELKTDTFRQHIMQNPVTLVEFYASWCGHCKAFAPVYEQVATALKEKNIPVAKIDAAEEVQIAEMERIEGFPTVRLYLSGEPIAYEGERSLEKVLNFVEKAQQPAFTRVETAEEFAKFREDNFFVAAAYPGDPEVDGTEIQEMFNRVASSLRFKSDIKFALASDASVLGAKNEDGPVYVVYRKDMPEERYVFPLNDGSDEASIDSRFERFCIRHTLPLAGVVNGGNIRSYLSTGLPFIWVVVDDSEGVDEKYPFVAEVAKKYVGKYVFFFLSKKEYEGQVEALNVKTVPGVVATDRLRHPMPADTPFDAEHFAKFAADYDQGLVPVELKSEEIPAPEEYEKMTVKKVVGKSWHTVVEDSTKDVFIKYYASWCGHCKALAPIYEKVAELIMAEKSNAEKLVIGEYNMPENEVEVNLGVEGFPTLIFYPAADKEHPIPYDGDRSAGSIIDFIKKHASSELKFTPEAQKEIDAFAESQKKDSEKLEPNPDEGEPLTDEQIKEIMAKIEEGRKKAAEEGKAEQKEEL